MVINQAHQERFRRAEGTAKNVCVSGKLRGEGKLCRYGSLIYLLSTDVVRCQNSGNKGVVSLPVRFFHRPNNQVSRSIKASFKEKTRPLCKTRSAGHSRDRRTKTLDLEKGEQVEKVTAWDCGLLIPRSTFSGNRESSPEVGVLLSDHLRNPSQVDQNGGLPASFQSRIAPFI